MNDVKKCPHCGKELHSNAQYCMYCMTRLQPKKDITPKGIGYKKWIIIGSVSLISIALIVCTILLLGQGSDPGNTRHHATINVDRDATIDDTVIADPSDDTVPIGTEDTGNSDTSYETEADNSQTPITPEKPGTQVPQNTGNGNKPTQTQPSSNTQPTSPATTQPTSSATTQPTAPVTTQPAQPTQPAASQPTDPVQPTTQPASTQPSCSHAYAAATCISPKTCSYCGDTQGTVNTQAHSWEAVMGTVHYEEVGHYETVEESYKKTVYLCFYCGYNQNGYDSLDALRSHMSVHSGASDYSYVMSRPNLLADTREVWETNTTQKWVVDTPAHDETVVTGYVCKLCNSKKDP